MQHTSRDHGGPAEFHEIVAQHIHRQVSGRVWNLRVEATPDCIVVHGRCRTYYVKQLALNAVLDLVSGHRVDVEGLQVA